MATIELPLSNPALDVHVSLFELKHVEIVVICVCLSNNYYNIATRVYMCITSENDIALSIQYYRASHCST